jgi:hypothetical protein
MGKYLVLEFDGYSYPRNLKLYLEYLPMSQDPSSYNNMCSILKNLNLFKGFFISRISGIQYFDFVYANMDPSFSEASEYKKSARY